ncbi:MAG: lysophospholipid acyltransferase family protein [Thermotogota bacterium]
MNLLKNIGLFFLNIYFYLVIFVLVFIYGSYGLIKAKILKRKSEEKSKAYVRKTVEKFGRIILRSLFCKVIVDGKENIPEKGPYVIVSNHQSYFDIPLIFGYIYPSGFVAKIELAKMPIVGKYITALDSVLINRKDPKSGAASLRRFAKNLKKGSIITVFPEGTRTKTGKIDEFKKGTLMVPFRYGISLLPLAIDGSFNVSKKGSFLFKPTTIKVKIFKPIDPKTFASEGELREHIKNEITKSLQEG